MRYFLQRTLVFIFAFALVSVIIIGRAPKAKALEAEYGQVASGGTRFRLAPSKEGEIIKEFEAGQVVEILDEIEDGENVSWYRVINEGKTGYIRSDFVQLRINVDRIGYVIEDGCNLRGGPGQSAYVVTKMEAGKSVRIRQMVNNWLYVAYDDQEGFVRSDLIRMTNQYGSGYDEFFERGMSGSAVQKLQNMLVKRGFLTKGKADGEFGPATQEALKQIQKLANLPVDGMAGPETIDIVYNSSFEKIIKKDPVIQGMAAFKGNVINLDWWKGGNKILQRPGGVAIVWDVATGKSFKIRRNAGTNHNDVVPFNADATAAFKSIVGSWTWERRAIIVQVGNKGYAGSMNCMPHAPDSQKNDNFPGHFCIHFKDSRTHGGNVVDKAHASAVNRAYNYGR